MTIDLHSLLTGETPCVKFEFEQDVTELSSDFDTATAHTVGTVRNHAGYMLLECAVTVNAKTLCGRCDSYFDWHCSYDMQSPVAIHLQNADEHDEYIVCEDGKLDVADAVRCFVSLELPLKFVCKDDCKGLCPICGHDLNNGSCGCTAKESDPRWAALKDYFKDNK